MTTAQENDLRAFLKIFGEIDESKCEFTDVPDLLVYHNGHVVGVEHTRLYSENPSLASGRQRRPQEKIHFRILDVAHYLFKQKSSIPIWLSVTFTEPFDYRTKDIDDVANALADAVFTVLQYNRRLAQPKVLVNIEAWQFQRRGLHFPQGIRAIHYTVENDPRMEVWGPSYGYGVPSLTIEQLEPVIQAKDARVVEYRKRCDEVWLLIVTDLGMPSSHFRVADDLPQNIFSTQFERLFLLFGGNSKLLELQIA
jgi:hypothetical protein